MNYSSLGGKILKFWNSGAKTQHETKMEGLKSQFWQVIVFSAELTSINILQPEIWFQFLTISTNNETLNAPSHNINSNSA